MLKVLSLIHHLEDGIKNASVLVTIDALIYKVESIVESIRPIDVRQHSLCQMVFCIIWNATGSFIHEFPHCDCSLKSKSQEEIL